MENKTYWAGIGSRDLPEEYIHVQENIGRMLANKGTVMLSGGASGSDVNFQRGVCMVNPSLCEIKIPWPGFNKQIREPSFDNCRYEVLSRSIQIVAAKYLIDNGIIPWYEELTVGVKKLHARNYRQIFVDEDTKVNFVVYFAPETAEGVIKGGTRSAVEIARNEGIPTFNISIEAQRNNLYEFINKL